MAGCCRALTPEQWLTTFRRRRVVGLLLQEASISPDVPTNVSLAARSIATIIDNNLPKEAKPDTPIRSRFESQMNCAASNLNTSHDRIRYALNRVNREEMSWTGRELFFLVKKYFPAESRSDINTAAATLCSYGEFSISGRRYQAKAAKPLQAEQVAVAQVQ